MDFGSFHNISRFRQYCKENIGKILRIEPEINTRSMSQNKLYWLYLEVIERETGNNANDLHELFKRKFLPAKFIKVRIKGKETEIKIPSSTTELNKLEFVDYMDKISSETEIAIPDSQSYNAEMELAQLN
jgi:hypothetical protein